MGGVYSKSTPNNVIVRVMFMIISILIIIFAIHIFWDVQQKFIIDNWITVYWSDWTTSISANCHYVICAPSLLQGVEILLADDKHAILQLTTEMLLQIILVHNSRTPSSSARESYVDHLLKLTILWIYVISLF